MTALAHLERTVVDELPIDEVLDLAAHGRRIVIVASDMELAYEAFEHLAREVAAAPVYAATFKVRRANGQQGLRHLGGGFVVFRSWRWHGSAVHGLNIDRAYLYELGAQRDFAGVPPNHLSDLLVGLVVGMSVSDAPAIVQVKGRSAEWAWPTGTDHIV